MILKGLPVLHRVRPILPRLLSPLIRWSVPPGTRNLSARTTVGISHPLACLPGVYPSTAASCLPSVGLPDRHVYRYSSQPIHGVSQDSLIKIGSLSQDDIRRVVNVTWYDGEKQDYPFTWLLDNCFCSECYHAESQCRLLPFVDLDTTATPESIETINHCGTLRISWNRHHCSDFNSRWLRTIRFDQESRDEIISPTPRLWGAEIAEALPKFDFQDVLSSDQILLEFLKAFSEFGIVKLEGTPTEPKQIPIIAKRIGPMRETSFGMIQPLKVGGNEVKDLEVDRALSYTTKALQLHTDMSCLDETTCMAFFHCIKASEDKGGYSMYSDGFKAADTLRRKDPHAFRTLCTNQLQFRLVGAEPHVGDFDHRTYHSPIMLDHFGQLKAICYSTHARLPSLRMSVDDVESMYSALQAFSKLIESPENVYCVKLQTGETFVVNNRRVLHGRTPFSVSSERHLELGYVDWDHVTSRMRALTNKLNGGKI